MPFSGGSSVVISGTPAVTVTSGDVNVTSGAVTVTSGNVNAEIDRKVTTVTVVILNAAALSAELDFRDYAGGEIVMPAGWTTADIGAYVSEVTGGTFQPLLDRSNGYGTDVSIDGPVVSKTYPIPPYWFGASYIKLWSHNGSGVDANQGGERSIKLMLKS